MENLDGFSSNISLSSLIEGIKKWKKMAGPPKSRHRFFYEKVLIVKPQKNYLFINENLSIKD